MGGLTRDTLYLACTRPAMRWGVPVEGYYLNLFGTFVFGMVMGSPLWWGLFVVFHLPMRALADRDPNFFRELRMWLETKGANIGGQLAALPSRRPRRAAGLTSSV
jgi:type IV secretion system protein VirB3